MRSSRLAWPLAISLVLHLCAGWLFSPDWAAYPRKSAKSVALAVSLASKERSDFHTVTPAQSPPVSAATPAAAGTSSARESAGDLTKKARFLVAPDLADLENIPVPFPGSATLRLHVSSLGTVDRVTVMKSGPIPIELHDGLLARFKQTRLEPALAGDQPVPSTLDLIIRYEPEPELLPHRR